jgi:hypothetical protein
MKRRLDGDLHPGGERDPRATVRLDRERRCPRACHERLPGVDRANDAVVAGDQALEHAVELDVDLDRSAPGGSTNATGVA